MNKTKNICLTVIIMLAAVLICSCSMGKEERAASGTDVELKKVQDAEYTEDNPYILENAELTYEETLYPVNIIRRFDYRVEYPYYQTISSFPKTHEGYNCKHDGMVLDVTKISSKTYYYMHEKSDSDIILSEPGSLDYMSYNPDNVITFTRTTLRVDCVMSGSGENFENIKAGDTVDVIEAFGYSPEGVLYSYCDNRWESDASELIDRGELVYLIYSIDNREEMHFNPYYQYGKPTMMRIGHKYNIVLYDDYIMDNITVSKYGTPYDLPRQYTEGAYFSPYAFEISEEALQTSYEYLGGGRYKDLLDYRINYPEDFKVYSQYGYYLTLWQICGERLNTIIVDKPPENNGTNIFDNKVVCGAVGLAGGVVITSFAAIIICKVVSKKRKRKLPPE